jgi:hypothetical protein
MALKAILAKLDEVDEQFRSLYTERNGKFEFTGVEGLKTQADIDRQLAANQKVRTDLTAAQTALKAANDKIAAWGDMTPEDVNAKLEKLATLEAGNSVPELAKNFETTVNARVAAVVDGKVKSETTKLQRTIDELKGQLTTATQSIQAFETKDNTRTIHDAVRAAATAGKVLPEAVPDLLAIAGQELKLVDGKPQTEDGRDPTAWLEDRKAKTPYFWAAAQGAGSRGANGEVLDGNNPFKREGHNVTKISQLVASNPTQAAKLAEQAGVPKDAAGNFQWHIPPPRPSKAPSRAVHVPRGTASDLSARRRFLR